jgi:hypothetical protein
MSMRRFETRVDVTASSSVVWNIMKDVEAWPMWTPTVTTVIALDGSDLLLDHRFEVFQPGVPKATFVVTEFVDGRSFTWQSKSGGVVSSAEHTVSVVDDSHCSVNLSFEMSGMGASLLWAVARKKIESFVQTEAASLKSAAEGQ